MKEQVEFKKIREFGEIIGDTFLFIKQNFKPLMKAVIYFCGLFILGGMLSYMVIQIQISELANSFGSQRADNPLDFFYNFSLSYLLVIIFSILSYTSLYVTVLSYIAVYIQKGNVAPNTQEVYVYFKYYFFKILGSGLIMTFFLGLCFLCCVIPGIWVLPAVTLFYPIRVMENAGHGFSFNRSFNLLKENWWITFATILVIGIIGEACKLIVQFPAIIIAWTSAFTHLESPITKTYAIVTSLANYLSLFFLIIPIIGSALIYFNLVERKESTGLLGRIADLGQSTKSDHSLPEEY